MRVHVYTGEDEAETQRYSCGIWVVLEKHGFLDVTEGPVSGAPQREGACAVVTAAAASSMSLAALAVLRAAHPVVVVEGPWSSALADVIGTCGEVVAARGSVRVEDEALRSELEGWLVGSWTPSYSGASSRELTLAMTPRVQRPHRQSDVADPMHEELVGAVPADPWSIRATTLPDHFEVVASVAAQPLVAEAPGLVLLPQPLLSYIVEDHSARVLHDVYEFSNDRFAFELLLLQVLTRAMTGQGAIVARIAPWPAGKDYALTIRHDVDRLPDEEVLESVLRLEAQSGAGVSAYFQSRTADAIVVDRFAENGAEIGWHVAQLYPDGEDELRQITGLGHDVRGVTVHGNQGNYGWRGLPNWRRSELLGMAYCENLASTRYLPSRAFDLADGLAGGREILVLPHHHSLDRGLNGTYRDEILAALPTLSALGAYVVVLNHPDINVTELGEVLDGMPERAWQATSRAVTDWWTATHYRDNLVMRVLVEDDTSSIHLQGRTDLEGLVLEIAGRVTDGPTSTYMGQRRSPILNGVVSRVRVDLSPNGMGVVPCDPWMSEL
ncbi:hypothetical protein [Euzebya pacifica]|uniref:hypothetical protein n=1 Tax=Euzebya pacifica TaxID=1608957 RepID=UPI000DF817BB|nr:hypothetical protein [Euzebya pacifica]